MKIDPTIGSSDTIADAVFEKVILRKLSEEGASREEDMDFVSEELKLEDGWRRDNDFIVAPVSFMSETVTHDGLKLWEEVEKTWQMWRNIPFTFDHPKGNTLKDPDDVIGFLRNVEKNDEKRRLEGEICIYTEPPVFTDRSESYWNVMLEELKNRDEISAGYYAVPEESSGTFTDIYGNEFDFDMIYRKIFPDHLASVDRGACSPGQGCGIDLNEREDEKMDEEDE